MIFWIIGFFATGSLVSFAIFILKLIAIFQRTEAEYGVLKTRIEKLEEELRNGR